MQNGKIWGAIWFREFAFLRATVKASAIMFAALVPQNQMPATKRMCLICINVYMLMLMAQHKLTY